MNGILIDSDILIEVFRQRDAKLAARWAAVAEGGEAVFCTPVSIAELWHGARENEYFALKLLFRAMTCVPIEETIGRRAGEHLRKYHRSHDVEIADALIAAAAEICGLRLWTRNRKHYPMSGIEFY